MRLADGEPDDVPESGQCVSIGYGYGSESGALYVTICTDIYSERVFIKGFTFIRRAEECPQLAAGI